MEKLVIESFELQNKLYDDMLRAKEEYEVQKTNDSQLQLDCYNIFFDKTLRTIEESIETIAKCTRENVDEYYNCRDEHVIVSITATFIHI